MMVSRLIDCPGLENSVLGLVPGATPGKSYWLSYLTLTREPPRVPCYFLTLVWFRKSEVHKPPTPCHPTLNQTQSPPSSPGSHSCLETIDTGHTKQTAVQPDSLLDIVKILTVRILFPPPFAPSPPQLRCLVLYNSERL